MPSPTAASSTATAAPCPIRTPGRRIYSCTGSTRKGRTPTARSTARGCRNRWTSHSPDFGGDGGMSGKSILTWEQYEGLLSPLTKELSDAARWIAETGQRVIIIFEGRDTAGKGGSIDMFARTLNPRQCHIAA